VQGDLCLRCSGPGCTDSIWSLRSLIVSKGLFTLFWFSPEYNMVQSGIQQNPPDAWMAELMKSSSSPERSDLDLTLPFTSIRMSNRQDFQSNPHSPGSRSPSVVPLSLCSLLGWMWSQTIILQIIQLVVFCSILASYHSALDLQTPQYL